jgi:hypothetical protein
MVRCRVSSRYLVPGTIKQEDCYPISTCRRALQSKYPWIVQARDNFRSIAATSSRISLQKAPKTSVDMYTFISLETFLPHPLNIHSPHPRHRALIASLLGGPEYPALRRTPRCTPQPHLDCKPNSRTILSHGSNRGRTRPNSMLVPSKIGSNTLSAFGNLICIHSVNITSSNWHETRGIPRLAPFPQIRPRILWPWYHRPR